MFDFIVFTCVILIILSTISLILVEQSNFSLRKDFLNEKEQALFRLLIETFPEAFVFTRISAFSILEPNKKINKKNLKKAFKVLKDHYLLFALYNKSDLSFICVVEFADHDKRILRDRNASIINKLLTANKILTLKISPFDFVDKAILRDQLNKLLVKNGLEPFTVEPVKKEPVIVEEPILPKANVGSHSQDLSLIEPHEMNVKHPVFSSLDEQTQPNRLLPLTPEEEEAILNSDPHDLDNLETLLEQNNEEAQRSMTQQNPFNSGDSMTDSPFPSRKIQERSNKRTHNTALDMFY